MNDASLTGMPEDGAVSHAPHSYLITWNPENWPWDTLQEDVASIKAGRTPSSKGAQRWSIGNNGRIAVGDRLFLMKQGKAPRGIIGLAVATSDSYEDLHWDPERAKNNDKTRYVDLRFESLLDPDVSEPLDPSTLAAPEASSIYWDTPRSGVQISDPVAASALAKAWHRHHAMITTDKAAATSTDQLDFIGVMRQYMDQRTVFQSTAHGRRYNISSVSGEQCEVHRLDSNDTSQWMSLEGYRNRLSKIRAAGGASAFGDLANSVAERLGYLQGPDLALSAKHDRVLDLSDPNVAIDNFCDVIKNLEVNRSGGKPRLYKPALVAVVLEAIRDGDLDKNQVVFDWVLPRFIAKLQSLGVTANPDQAAVAFFHLTSDQFWFLSYVNLNHLVDAESVSRKTVSERVSHAKLKEPYWRAIQDPVRLEKAIEAVSSWWQEQPPAPATQYWWVNQGKTYAEEREKGIIWAPQRNQAGSAFFHWTNVSAVRAGDLVFHYADGEIRAVSIAQGDGRAGVKPVELDGQPWEKEGWTADLEYHDLLAPVPLSAVEPGITALNLERGPINTASRVNQGYLFRLSQEAAAVIAGRLDSASLPAALIEKLPLRVTSTPRYWAIGLGPNGKYWPECRRDGKIIVGADFTDDLRKYATKADFTAAIAEHRKNGVDPVNDAHMYHQFCNEMKIGDFVVAKIGLDKVLGLGRVTSDYYPAPEHEDYKHARDVEWLAKADLQLPEDARVPLKTLTDVTNFERFVSFVKEHFPIESQTERPSYTIDDALESVFMLREEFVTLVDNLRRKKNTILAGAPGVGKTFIAKRLAYALMGVKDPSRVEMVQFHQSYAYEDFIQGWRPDGDGGFFLKPGVFFEFVEQAKRDTTQPHVFIIDEINRGNLSRIFGELLSLMEQDRRGPDYAVPLTYAKNRSDRFYLPENLYLIGMMNTADRSLAMVDYALRRRFSFATLRPAFASPSFVSHLTPLIEKPVINMIVARMTALNQVIAQEADLGKGFVIGHSFFCPQAGNAGLLGRHWYDAVVKAEIAPLLHEYWFDDSDRAEELVAGLLQ